MASNFISIIESLHFIGDFSLLCFTSFAGNAWYGSKSSISNRFFPWITLISEFKLTIFTVSGSLIALALFFQWHTKYLPCPLIQKKKIMSKLKKNKLDIIIYLFGFLFSWILFCIYCCLYSLLKEMKYISFSKN